MNRHRRPALRAADPTGPPRVRSRLAFVALVALVAITGCVTQEDAADQITDAVVDADGADIDAAGTDDREPGPRTVSDRPSGIGDDLLSEPGFEPTDGRPAGDLRFGDPADYGFAPVEGDDRESATTDEDPKQPDDVELPSPDEVIPEVADDLETGRGGGETLDAVDTLQTEPSEPSDTEAAPVDPVGEPAGLDDQAGLACANTEIALGHFDEGRVLIAAERLALAAEHARSSSQPSVQAWADPLSDLGLDLVDGDLAVMVGFIVACAERGYEL